MYRVISALIVTITTMSAMAGDFKCEIQTPRSSEVHSKVGSFHDYAVGEVAFAAELEHGQIRMNIFDGGHVNGSTAFVEEDQSHAELQYARVEGNYTFDCYR